MKLNKLVTLGGIVCMGSALLTGCQTTPPPPAFDDDSIRTILITPVVTQSNVVGSDMLLYSATTFPIAERGYYPYPVETVKMVLEQEGLYEPERVQQIESSKLAELFGSDAVLKILISQWDAQYAVLNTSIVVTAHYTLDRKDGTNLWSDTVKFVWRSDGGQAPNSLAGLLVQVAAAAIHRAAPDFRPAAQQVSAHALRLWKIGPYLREEIAKQVEAQGKTPK